MVRKISEKSGKIGTFTLSVLPLHPPLHHGISLPYYKMLNTFWV